MRTRRKTIALLLAALLGPPVLWCLIVGAMPTGPIRCRIERAIARATGHEARIGEVSLRLGGGLHLSRLSLYGPGRPAEPWLEVESLWIDPDPGRLFQLRYDPATVRIDGVIVRIRRDADGRCDLASLLDGPRGGPGDGEGNDGPVEVDLAFQILRGRVIVADVPSRSHFQLDRVEGRGRRLGPRTIVDDLRGSLNGGRFAVTAEIDRGRPEPEIDLQLLTRGVGIDFGTNLLTYLAPVLGGVEALVDGRMDLDLDLIARGRSAEAWQSSLQGEGSVRIQPLRLQETPLVADLSKLVRLPADRATGTFQSAFSIRDRTIRSPEMTLSVGKTPILLSGTTDFDGRVDYEIRADAWLGRLQGEALQWLDELRGGGLERPILRLHGTIDRLDLAIDDLPITGRDGVVRDREKLQELGRRVLDKLLR